MFGLRLWPLKVMKAVALTLHQLGTDNAFTIPPMHSVPPLQVLKRLLRHKTGNVHYEFLEHEIAMLVPSLRRAGVHDDAAAIAAAGGWVTMDDRVADELGASRLLSPPSPHGICINSAFESYPYRV
jgi:hypothetical protein